jgi:hypothetical protein
MLSIVVWRYERDDSRREDWVDREQLSQIRTHTADGRVESTLAINSCMSLNSCGRSDMVFREFDGYLVMSLVLFGFC